MLNTQNQGIQAAIQIAGSQIKLARHLTAGQSTINDWLHGRNPVPISVALYLEETFSIPRAWFRADLGTVCRGMVTFPFIETTRRPFDSGMSSPALLEAMTYLPEPLPSYLGETTPEVDDD